MERAFKTTNIEVVFPTSDELERRLADELLGRGPRAQAIRESFEIGNCLDKQGCLKIKPRRPAMLPVVRARVDARVQCRTQKAGQEEEAVRGGSWERPEDKRLARVDAALAGFRELEALKRRRMETEMRAGLTPAARLWAKANSELLGDLERRKGVARDRLEEDIVTESARQHMARGNVLKSNKFSFR